MNPLVLIGIIVLAAGTALVVQGVQAQRRALQGYGILAAGAGLVLTAASFAFVIVPAGHSGVVFDVFGGVAEEEVGEGFHLILPVLQRVTVYDIRQHELTLADETGDEVTARSSEGLEITVDATVLYQPAPDMVARLHQDIGDDYERVRVRPEARTQIRDGIAQYAAAELISTQRTELQERVETSLTDALEGDNVRILSVLLRDVRIPESITTAVEEKQAAEQQVEVEENRRLQSEVSAERRVVEAEGERDAEIARAEGRAEALKLRGEAIRETPELIQLEVAEHLAPSINTVMLPSDNNFLMDLRSMGDLAPSTPPSEAASLPGNEGESESGAPAER